jgi:DNA-binding HxlR family transcriptional regulator
MDKEPGHLGNAMLGLLKEDGSVPILRALMDGPRRPSELERRLPEITHAALTRRLGELRGRGLAEHLRHSGLPPSARYTLSGRGRAIIGVIGAAERWEHKWATPTAGGTDALRLVADETTRRILLAIAPAPLTASELDRQTRLSRTPLRNRLADLLARGVLASSGHRYELTESARDLMLISIAAARWEWEFDRPAHEPPALNVARAVHMYAPRAQLAADLQAACTVHVEAHEDRVSVDLKLEGRQLAPLTQAPPGPPDATCRGRPRAWCDGLLLGRWRDVAAAGDSALMAAILGSLTAALVA